ncbi:hypothetical protein BAMBUS_05120 [Brevundimonas phage vB_BpoS-Bambus]|nr:hypothetical protein BAMBUS_05120 [Brevundimonas phage vB_BpoS-Bambus]
MSLLGYCPVCGDGGHARERRPGGNDRCGNGHVYPTHLRFLHPPTQAQMDAYKLGGFTRPIATHPERVGALAFAVASHAQAEALIPLVTSFPTEANDGVRVIPYGAKGMTYVGRRQENFRALVVIPPREGDLITREAFDEWLRDSINCYVAPGAPTVIL